MINQIYGAIYYCSIQATILWVCDFHGNIIVLSICQLESIEELERFVMNHRKDYVDLHRNTEQEWDNIEHEVSSLPILTKSLQDSLC